MSLQEGTTVRVHYRGTLDDGAEFDTSEDRDPLEFTIGAGQVIGGFERAVADLEVGGSVTVTLRPEEAYGPHMADAIQEVPVGAFWEPPQAGMTVQLVDPDGRELVANVTEVGEESAKLDFNHPLAGENLTFTITLLEVAPAD